MTEETSNKDYWHKLEKWGDMLEKELDDSIDKGFKRKMERKAEETVVMKDAAKNKDILKDSPLKKQEGKS